MTLYLVTGGAGFIGSHLVEALVEHGEHVRVLDDFSTGQWENLAAVANHIELLEGDIADPETVEQAMAGCHYVLHLAAIASVQASLEEPRRIDRVNVGGTLHVLEAARRAGVRRVVLASSAAVYGDHSALPQREELPLRPLSPYAASKAAGEAYCSAFHASYGLPTVVLRFFNVYGPRQDPSSPYSGVISIFAARMTQGQRPAIYGDGEQTRDFVYVADVVQALLLVCERETAVGAIFNVASGRQTRILQLATTLNEVLDTNLTPTFAPARAGEVRFSEGDARRAQEALGWEATTPLREGLSSLVQWNESTLPMGEERCHAKPGSSPRRLNSHGRPGARRGFRSSTGCTHTCTVAGPISISGSGPGSTRWSGSSDHSCVGWPGCSRPGQRMTPSASPSPTPTTARWCRWRQRRNWSRSRKRSG